MQKKKNIEIAREEAGLSVEELRSQRLELLPDRIELHRRHRRNRRRNHNGGAHSVNISGGYGGGVSSSGGSL